jgi:hypothetical protein
MLNKGFQSSGGMCKPRHSICEVNLWFLVGTRFTRSRQFAGSGEPRGVCSEDQVQSRPAMDMNQGVESWSGGLDAC